MSDLETLRPEVQKALDDLSYFLTGTHNHDDFYAIRAELLRLADENARLSGRLCLVCGLHNDSQCPQRNDEMSPCTFDPSPVEAAKAFFARATKAEAELAVLKARIAGSRHAFLGPNMDRITFLADEIGPSRKYALVKVEE